MPLTEDGLQDARGRVFRMFMDTVQVFRMMREEARWLFGDAASEIAAAIDEYMRDFIDEPQRANQLHPEVLIYNASAERLQDAGLYGAQLALKESRVLQVTASMRSLRNVLPS